MVSYSYSTVTTQKSSADPEKFIKNMVFAVSSEFFPELMIAKRNPPKIAFGGWNIHPIVSIHW